MTAVIARPISGSAIGRPSATIAAVATTADYAPDPVQGARWAEAAFAEENEEEDGDATDDENDAS